MKNNSHEQSLDRLLEIERDIQANLARGSIDAVEFHRAERDKLYNEILENQKIVERLKSDYNDYKDGFSTLEGWVMDNPELREAVDRFLESILKESQA